MGKRSTKQEINKEIPVMITIIEMKQSEVVDMDGYTRFMRVSYSRKLKCCFTEGARHSKSWRRVFQAKENANAMFHGLELI